MKKKIILMGLGFIIALIIYVSFFNMTPSDVYDNETISFSKDGFVDSMELDNRNYLVTSNDKFELYVDEKTSHFKVVSKETDVVWNSNPQILDPWQFDSTKTITRSAIEKQKATLELTYYNETGSVAKINNYSMSINHPDSVLHDAGLRTYSIKYLDDGFQVLYNIMDVDIDYLHFPKFLEPEIYEMHPRKDVLEA
jgi:hypothetical protein